MKKEYIYNTFSVGFLPFFFLWAISSNLRPTMMRQLMKTCELYTFEASFYRDCLLAGLFYFPHPHSDVYETLQL